MVSEVIQGADTAAPDRSRARRQLQAASIACSAAAAALVLVGLAGWVFHAPILTRLHAGYATMKFGTAVLLLLLAAAMLLEQGGRSARVAAVTCAVTAGVGASIVLLEYATGHGFGIDQLVYTDHGAGAHPGRPSLATASAALLMAATYLPPVARRLHVTQTIAIVVLSVSGLAMLGFAYGISSLYALSPYATVAVHTALALMLLALARLLTIERGVAEWMHAGVKPGAVLMRFVVPSAVIGLPVVGYLCVLAQRQSLVDGDDVVAMFVLLSVLALVAAAWAAGVNLDRVDRRRRRALADLHALADDLERQVVHRSEQVQQGRDELVLLADRQRIAADLHDVVVQRLFAAGMSLDAIDPDVVPAAVGGRITESVEAMDSAIRDLRASIFELSRPVVTTPDLVAALDGICVEAARVLGFEPDLIVDDPDDEAERLRTDVLAVTRESLANVARHARATAVSVTLRSGDGSVSLVIGDDGVGMTRAPHSSGTRNMQERAERRGGTCTWSPAQPHGTTVVWQVPSAPVEQSTPAPVAVRQPVAEPAEAKPAVERVSGSR